MDNIGLIPGLALLIDIQKVVPQALLGGGCLRDTIMGVEVKDIDIFVPERSAWAAEDVIRQTRPTLTVDVPEPYFIWDESVKVVREFEGDGVLPVNLIGLSEGCTAVEQLTRFDFGICRVVHDGKELIVSKDFLKDKEDRTFTLLRSGNEAQRECSLKRFERLSKKYPGWTLVEPPRPVDDDWF